MKISQAFRFEVAHRLPETPATHKCSRMHGQSYRTELQVVGPIDPVTEFVVVVSDLGKSFAEIVTCT
ncbi:6-pyruvoyl tetrahydropterin synthase family protein [Bradyrhizobium sp. CCGB20]|uniref:6-pyruvoyl tetrahydropterin synthase family protein n=1 Tax=Bradyrhizobium sp. CCGB20 TaxID=2949633 RepID=UPI0035C6E54F